MEKSFTKREMGQDLANYWLWEMKGRKQERKVLGSLSQSQQEVQGEDKIWGGMRGGTHFLRC